MNLFQRIKGIIRFRLSEFILGPSDPLKYADFLRKKGLKVGVDSKIYRNVVIGQVGRDPIVIGNNCVLTGCTVLGHDASTNAQLGRETSLRKQTVLQDNVFVGFNATILMGVTVGEGAIVGAGAVVTTNVPERCVVAGNPARIVCSVDELVKKRRSEM